MMASRSLTERLEELRVQTENINNPKSDFRIARPAEGDYKPKGKPKPEIPQDIAVPPGVDIDKNMSEALRHRSDWDGGANWFYNQVKAGGPWDYKKYGRQYENFGNYHYGAMGATMGFSEGTLLRMAGWANVQATGGRVTLGWGKPPDNQLDAFRGVGGIAPYGDDPRDQQMIKEGIKYRKEYEEYFWSSKEPESNSIDPTLSAMSKNDHPNVKSGAEVKQDTGIGLG
jgi:Bacterial toxin 44